MGMDGTAEVDALKQEFEDSLAREAMTHTNNAPVADDVGGMGASNARETGIEDAYKRHLHKMSNLVDMEDFDQRQMDEQHFQREMLAQMRRKEQFDERKRLQIHQEADAGQEGTGEDGEGRLAAAKA